MITVLLMRTLKKKEKKKTKEVTQEPLYNTISGIKKKKKKRNVLAK